jgi:hypothetical protein
MPYLSFEKSDGKADYILVITNFVLFFKAGLL